ncbi:MAG TPA: cation diffusion facilitator family transporter [Chryseosolibacter sp.]
MAHDHHHHHHHHFDPEEKPSGIVTAFWLNTAFAIVEIAGGIYTNSVAIVSDAVHDLGDSLSLGLAYYFHRKSKQQRDPQFNYGYRRFSLLGAFINSLVLVVSSVFIIGEAFQRLFEPEMPDTQGMLILAILGILVNGAALLRLRKGKSVNEKVISLHFVEDVLGWTAVLIGSIVMMFVDVPVLDPVLSILICLYILYNVYKNLRTTFRILLQGSPEGIQQDEVRKKVLSVPGVLDMHDMHFWTMDGQYNVMTLHVVVSPDKTLEEVEEIKNEVKHCLIHLDVQHTTVEIESQNNNCYAELKKPTKTN